MKVKNYFIYFYTFSSSYMSNKQPSLKYLIIIQLKYVVPAKSRIRVTWFSGDFSSQRTYSALVVPARRCLPEDEPKPGTAQGWCSF